MAESAPPTCPRHPDVVAYVSCQRCGRPACPDCQRVAAVGVQCVDCVREQQAGARRVRNRLGFVGAPGEPIVAIGLIVVNVIVWVAGMALGSPGFFDWGLCVPAEGAPGCPGGAGTEWWRWFTSGFVHTGILHLGLNMVMLYMFGRELERILGRARFALLYFGSLVGASALIWLVNQVAIALGVGIVGTQGATHGGASGAIYGLLAACVVVALRLRLNVRTLVVIAGGWLVAGFVVGLSWQGHLGGAIAGAAIVAGLLAAAARPRPPASDS